MLWSTEESRGWGRFRIIMKDKKEFWGFVLRLLITILTAIAGAIGASACGLSEVASASAGFVLGTISTQY